MPRRPLGRRPGRPLRRPHRGALGRRGIPGIRSSPTGGRRIPPALKAANQLFRSGDYEAAGKTYLNLAERGFVRGFRHAPNLYFQAARCYTMLGDAEIALKIIHKAIEHFAQEERWADLYRGVNHSVGFLIEKGYSSEANIIEGWTVEVIPASIFQNLETSFELHRENKLKVILPIHCSSCGGTVNPAEVEWVDETCVICDFCGSTVRGE